jgi:hypothetical protein
VRTTERNESSRVQFYTIYRGRTYSVFGFISEYPPPHTHMAPRGAPPSERLRTARGRSAHSPHAPWQHAWQRAAGPGRALARGGGAGHRAPRAAGRAGPGGILYTFKKAVLHTHLAPPQIRTAHIPHIPAHRSYPHARTHSRGQPHTHTVPLNTPCTRQKRRIDNMISAQWSLPVAGEGSSLRPPD